MVLGEKHGTNYLPYTAIQNFIKDIIKKLAIPYIEQGFTPTFIFQKSVNFGAESALNYVKNLTR